MANIGLRFSVDVASIAKISQMPEHLDSSLDARLQAAYRKLVPGEPPPPDALRQAALLADEGLINERELADRLKVSLSLVQHWRSSGCGPTYYKFGDSRYSIVRYSWFEVLAWLRETFWVRPAKPKMPHKIAYKAGDSVAWEFAAPTETDALDPAA